MRVVRVYLIRHGETNWNKKHKIQGGGYDVPLNETGKEQALKSAKALEGILFDAVASLSPARAKETADIVLDYISSRQTNAKQPLRIVDAGYNRTNNNRKATMENESKLDNEIDDPADKALVEHVLTYGDFHAEPSANNNNNASSPHPSDLVPNSCIRPDDILFYTSGQSQRKGHPGNVKFRKLLASLIHKYNNSNKTGKSCLSGRIYKATVTKGGRFLKQKKTVDQNGEPVWYVMDARKARGEIGSRFRQLRFQMIR